MEFFCIADKDSGLGFRLAGIKVREASSKDETLKALDEALAEENVGVIIITQMAASLVRDRIEDLIYSKRLPLILEVPSRTDQKKKFTTGALLKKAIGISV